MAAEDDNVNILKGAYAQWAALKAADCSCWMSIAADDILMQSLASGRHPLPFTETRSGKDQLLAYFSGLTSDWEMLSYDVNEYIAQGDRVVAIARTAWRNRATGKVADTPKIDLWRFHDGKVVELAEFYDTAHVFSAALP